MQLFDAGEEVRPGAALGVVRGALVRILPVGELDDLLERDQMGSGNVSRSENHVAIAAS